MDTGALNMDIKLKITTFMQECSEKNLTQSFKSLKKIPVINVKHSTIPPLQEEHRKWGMSTWSTSKKKMWLEITGQLWRWMLKMRKLFWLLLLTWRNAHSVIEAAARKHTNYNVAQWETAIQFAFKKNPAEVDSLKCNVINFQSHEAFLEYTNMLSNKAQENDIVLPNKESKVYWSKLMIKFSKNNMD